MKLPPQPPPGPDVLEELPPEGWRGVSPRTFWMLVVAGVVGLLLIFLILPPMILRSRKAGCRTLAVSNAKQVGQALLEFDVEYGSFPNDATVPLVEADTSSGFDFSDGSSNAMFRQLIAYGIQTEQIFHCLHPEAGKRPDDNMSPTRVLEAGENGFSYVSGLDSSMSPDLPFLAASMKIGNDSFWRPPFKGKAVILRIDNSVEAFPIRRSDGKVVLPNGMTLFEPGNGLWPPGHVPDLRHPLK